MLEAAAAKASHERFYIFICSPKYVILCMHIWSSRSMLLCFGFACCAFRIRPSRLLHSATAKDHKFLSISCSLFYAVCVSKGSYGKAFECLLLFSPLFSTVAQWCGLFKEVTKPWTIFLSALPSKASFYQSLLQLWHLLQPQPLVGKAWSTRAVNYYTADAFQWRESSLIMIWIIYQIINYLLCLCFAGFAGILLKVKVAWNMPWHIDFMLMKLPLIL